MPFFALVRAALVARGASRAAGENLSELDARLVKLRLRRADGAAEYPRDLLVLVAFNVVEYEGGAIAGRQLRQRAVERDAVGELCRVRPARAERLDGVRLDAIERVLPA